MVRKQPAPHIEAFNGWLDEPVTRMVFQALLSMADEQRAEWVRRSWEGGHADEKLLIELRTRADAYSAMADTDYFGFCDAAGLEPSLK